MNRTSFIPFCPFSHYQQKGLAIENAVKRRITLMGDVIRRFQSSQRQGEDGLSSSLSSSMVQKVYIADDDQLVELVMQDTLDDFRLFEMLEPYLYQPDVFLAQTIIQLPRPHRLRMVEKYYEVEDAGRRQCDLVLN